MYLTPHSPYASRLISLHKRMSQGLKTTDDGKARYESRVRLERHRRRVPLYREHVRTSYNMPCGHLCSSACGHDDVLEMLERTPSSV
jgi:hypothetical protein